MLRQVVTAVLLNTTALASATALSHEKSGDCCFVEKVVCVPTWVTETRICKETHYRREERTKTCTVCKEVPVTKDVECKYTVWVRKKVPQTREIEVCTPTAKQVEQKYTVSVPATETVVKLRRRHECVPTTETRTVCKDEGHWEEREVACVDRCGCPSTRIEKCWVPKIVKTEVEVTVNKKQCVEEPYECQVKTCVDVEKSRTVTVYDTKKETKTVTDWVTTLVPEERTTTKTVTYCDTVQEEKVVTYTVCVPYTVEKAVEVRVCKMVPKTIRVPASCCPCK